MKNCIKALFVMGCLSSSMAYAQQTITMESMLREMVNRERLAEFPTDGHRTLQASSYNRESVSPDQPGWFADSDGVWCIRTEKNRKGETEWVLMEDDGPGAITKMWAVCFYYGLDNTVGANLNIYLDGAEEPTIRCNFFDLVRGRAFVKPPLAAETRRAGNCYLPIPYAKGCKITMDKKVFYNIINYQSFPKGTKVRTFSMADFRKAEALVDSVNQVLKAGAAQPLASKKIKTQKKNLVLAPGQSQSWTVGRKAGAVKKMAIRLKAENMDQALRSTVLKMKFDGEQTVWTPVGDFFNVGVGLKYYTMWERQVSPDGTMVCRWVMPYEKNAEVEFENLGEQKVELATEFSVEPYQWTSQSMHFHSSWRMDDPTPGFPLFDYNLLTADGKGVYVGDQFTVLNPEEGWWGEGDEKVYVDDDTFPSHFGTGTEDYYGWAGGVVPTSADEFHVPFLSNVRVAMPNSMGYNTCTRTRVLDAIPFTRHLNFNIESSGSNRTSWFHLQYAVNTYWYARPGAKTNRKPLPEMASRKITKLEELQKFNESCKSSVYTVPNAVEAENLTTYRIDNGIQQLAEMSVWGELSNGKVKAFQFTEEGQRVTVRLSELFADFPLKVGVICDGLSGTFDILVNGRFVTNVSLASEHSMVSTISLGTISPVDNAAEITFVCKKKGRLGIDYFLTK